MNCLIPGGAGYIGAMLVPWLLARGHHITVYDTMFFGNGYLPEDNAHLTIIKGDVRNLEMLKAACDGKDAVIWLASLSSNEMCERDPMLADAVNSASFAPGFWVAREAGVKRFIYASSVAVYGDSESPAKETQRKSPSTLYGQGKFHCDTISLGPQTVDCTVTVTRCASVCGYSPHQRLDLTVNMMVHDACRRGVITVNGGAQKRSHIHIHDVCDFYALLLDTTREKTQGAFNVVTENATVLDTARIVADETGALIDVRDATDKRSYTVDGTKAREVLGFVPKRSVRQAVSDLKVRFDAGYWKDSLTNHVYQNLADGLV